MSNKRKKPSKRGAQIASNIKISDEVDTSKVKFASGRFKVYDAIRERIEQLTKNKSFALETPAGVTLDVFKSRLTMALNRDKPKMKPGLGFRKGTDLEGRIVISAIELKGKASKPKPAKKSKRKAGKKAKPAAAAPAVA